MTMTYREGDEIFVMCDSRTVPGKMMMISTNQVAAMISFDGMLGGHMGMMPIMRHDAAKGIYRSIIDGTEVTFRKK